MATEMCHPFWTGLEKVIFGDFVTFPGSEVLVFAGLGVKITDFDVKTAIFGQNRAKTPVNYP